MVLTQRGRAVNPDELGLMSVSDVARRLDITTQRVRQIADAGGLRVAGRTRGGRVFLADDVEALRDAREREAAEREAKRRGAAERTGGA